MLPCKCGHNVPQKLADLSIKVCYHSGDSAISIIRYIALSLYVHKPCAKGFMKVTFLHTLRAMIGARMLLKTAACIQKC